MMYDLSMSKNFSASAVAPSATPLISELNEFACAGSTSFVQLYSVTCTRACELVDSATIGELVSLVSWQCHPVVAVSPVSASATYMMHMVHKQQSHYDVHSVRCERTSMATNTGTSMR